MTPITITLFSPHKSLKLLNLRSLIVANYNIFGGFHAKLIVEQLSEAQLVPFSLSLCFLPINNTEQQTPQADKAVVF